MLGLDCANGVGATAIKTIADLIKNDLYIQCFNIDIDTKELLNNQCGAEFVQKDVKYPSNISKVNEQINKFASFDGDADRLIYFLKKGDTPLVIDGDKQFALLMLYIT